MPQAANVSSSVATNIDGGRGWNGIGDLTIVAVQYPPCSRHMATIMVNVELTR